jgi:hypothetical protein
MELFTPIEYLKIAIANSYGLDKEQFQTRINWTDAHESILENLYTKAEEPFIYISAVMAYRDAQNGIPTGFMVEIDSCASGAALMAAFIGCPVSAANIGLIGNIRSDVYSKCTEAMERILNDKIHCKRKIVKAALMTYLYESKAEPKIAFGENTPNLAAFYMAVEEVVPGAVEILNITSNTWQSNELYHSWVMPDGFEVVKPVMVTLNSKIEVNELDHASIIYRYKANRGKKKGLCNSADIVHSCDALVCREMGRRCNYNKELLLKVKFIIKSYIPSNSINNHSIEALYKKHNFLSLVGVEYINETNVHQFSSKYLQELLYLIDEVLQYRSHEIVFIHDAFKSHANHMNNLRKHYISIMAEIADSTIFDTIISDITGKPYKLKKYTEDLGDMIRSSNYLLS